LSGRSIANFGTAQLTWRNNAVSAAATAKYQQQLQRFSTQEKRRGEEGYIH
jgi:hypothetical protein